MSEGLGRLVFGGTLGGEHLKLAMSAFDPYISSMGRIDDEEEFCEEEELYLLLLPFSSRAFNCLMLNTTSGCGCALPSISGWLNWLNGGKTE